METILWAKKNDKKFRHFFDYQKMKEINGGKQMKDVWLSLLEQMLEKNTWKYPKIGEGCKGCERILKYLMKR